jgi:hypothetical protein
VIDEDKLRVGEVDGVTEELTDVVGEADEEKPKEIEGVGEVDAAGVADKVGWLIEGVTESEGRLQAGNQKVGHDF